jgi:formate dehydrogenase subunit gamma
MGVLVQSWGETWRQIRNGPITVWGGWFLVVFVAVLAIYFFLKGPLHLRERPTGRMLLRFNVLERVHHWTVAISFVVLAITGATMIFGKHVLLPIIGYTLFSWWSIAAKSLHNFIAPVFMVALLIMIATWAWDNLPRGEDWRWLARFLRLRGGEPVPSGRFNTLQKGWFWVGVTVIGLAVSLSGAVLLFPNFDQTRHTMQLAHIVHSSAAIIFMAAALGHIYMGTIGMEGAYRSMRTGYVDETWAKEHHLLWYEQEMRRASQAGSTGAPRPAPGHLRAST